MDSPTLASFNYDQFWLEIYQHYEANANANATASRQEPIITPISTAPTSETPSPQPSQQEVKKVRNTVGPDGSEDYKATKNMVKNYGKAIASFASSKISAPYLTPILEQNHLDKEDFLDYMKVAKSTIQGIDTFRNLILTNKDDGPLLAAQKKVFREIGVIFIKYFSVNWIMNGKLAHKITYLKYRFKILRRIQNPASFTYLRSHKANEAKNKKKRRRN